METVELEAIASIMYTSGTTGQAKGVLQSFGNHFYSAVASALNLGLSANDQWLCAVPLFHISGFSILMRGLIYGMTVRLVRRFEPRSVETILVSEPVTIISAVPYMLQELLKRSMLPRIIPSSDLSFWGAVHLKNSYWQVKSPAQCRSMLWND